uniref:Uncharacterized protein n=1 Tax=Romanomermis culicivorax TaxID=13658 RepID=A0A915L8Z6_ROMCU
MVKEDLTRSGATPAAEKSSRDVPSRIGGMQLRESKATIETLLDIVVNATTEDDKREAESC